MSARITISLVTFNSAQVIAGCLESIPAEIPVMILDNNSRDDTIAVARAVRPSVTIVKARKNLGFGRAHNYNLRRTKTEFGLVLNPDTVLLPGCLEHLLHAADSHANAAIIGGQHYHADGKTPVVCIGTDTYCQINLEREKQRSTHARKHPDALCCVEYIIGALMLFRMAHFQKTGLFDRKIFMYHEDVEICARVRKAGYTVLFEPLAKVVHLCGQSSKCCPFVARLKQFYHSQCKLIVFRKYHSSPVRFYLFALREILMQLRRLLKATLTLNWLGMHKHAAGICGVFSGLRKA